MAGKCKTITNSASAEARVEAWAELGKIPSNSKVRIEGIIEPCAEPKNSPLEAQKVYNNPKIKLKSKVITKGNIENKSCSTT